ncbi:hypothetical protein AWM68_13430 [Fictibacillus phosphorivorans]|uniref:Peptidase C-terminal archaeal/bacterial domain-containing protein n=1 Tax=Fictibacillus phosphorivorans TaxID=1221500 RepID=A0A161THG0_9BACL|nr:hypothetical protein [Fictibacillus phosphorivorans]KZE64102.1 hypothetical protein AWM68_13430 [Fictibacillus phosphorivorans]
MKFSKIFVLTFLFVAIFLLNQNKIVSASVSNAVQINLYKTYTGEFNTYYGNYYKFTIPNDGNVALWVKSTADDGYVVGEILDQNGETLSKVDTSYDTLVSGYAIAQVGLPKGTYYIKNDGGYGSTYEFKVSYMASNNYEKEVNDSMATANSIKLKESYIGRMKDDYDEDFYTFTLPSDGKVKFSMKQKSGVKWYASIYNSNGKLHEEIETDSSTTVNGYETNEIGLPKGTYYIKIEDGFYTRHEAYEIKVEFTSRSYYEKEFNNDASTANTIKLNQTYKGKIEDYDDSDFYKIILPSDGIVTLSVNRKSGMSWQAELFNTKGDKLEDLNTNASSIVSGYETKQIGLPKGTYYINLSDYYGTEDTPYEIKAGFVNTNYYEKEFNNEIMTANAVKLNQYYKGKLSQYDDVDVFKFSVPADGNVTLLMKEENGVNWEGTIQNSTGKEYSSFVTNSDAFSGNKYTTVSLKKGTYYFVIEGYANAYQKTYEFMFYMKSNSVKTSNVKVINNKSKSDSISVSGLAKGDVVKVYNSSTKGTMLASKTSTGSSALLSIKQLGTKSGKVYVTVTKAGYTESNRVAVTFTGEQANALVSSQVKITNNKKKNDLIYVSKLKKSDVIKVYSASTGGKLLATSTSKGTSLSISLKQLGTKAGTVYMTITPAGMKESTRTAIRYSKE